MMPRFFKDMPKDKNETGVWKIEVFKILYQKDLVVYSELYEGKKWIAYVKVRLKALLIDWKTTGSICGIGYAIEEQEVKKESLK